MSILGSDDATWWHPFWSHRTLVGHGALVDRRGSLLHGVGIGYLPKGPAQSIVYESQQQSQGRGAGAVDGGHQVSQAAAIGPDAVAAHRALDNLGQIGLLVAHGRHFAVVRSLRCTGFTGSSKQISADDVEAMREGQRGGRSQSAASECKNGAPRSAAGHKPGRWLHLKASGFSRELGREARRRSRGTRWFRAPPSFIYCTSFTRIIAICMPRGGPSSTPLDSTEGWLTPCRLVAEL